MIGYRLKIGKMALKVLLRHSFASSFVFHIMVLNKVGRKKSIWRYITILQYFLLPNVTDALAPSVNIFIMPGVL